jgi:hypothetical protein
VPLDALDLGLFNWNHGGPRATLGLGPDAEQDEVLIERVRAGLDL